MTQSGRPDPNALEQQAADWVAALQAEDSPAARRRLQAWLMADPRHAVAFARAEYAWQAAARLAASGGAGQTPLTAAGGLERPAAASTVGRRWIMAAAAAGLAGVGVWRAASPNVFETSVGERRTLVLDDGSRAHLNTASRLETRFTRARRGVRLVRGEALFEVADDAVRPFVVEAGAAQLRATQTTFNVRLRPQLVELTVTRGVVGVTGRADRSSRGARIAAGEGAAIGGDAVAETRLRAEDLMQRTAWTDGVVELDGATLDQAVAEFNRYRETPILIGDPRLATLRVGGRFPANDSDLFVRALTAAFPVTAVPTSGGVLLVPRA